MGGFGLNSAVNSGHLKNVLDLSQSYSGTVYGFSNGFGNISGFLSPIITGIIIESNPSDPVKWQYVFLIPMALFSIALVNFVYNAQFNFQTFDIRRPPQANS